MSVMAITVVEALSVTLVLVTIHTLIFIQNRENYLRSWMIAWITVFLCYICFFGLLLIQSLLILYMVFSCFSGYFLLLASYQLLKLKMSSFWLYITLIMSAWLIACVTLRLPSLLSIVPWSIFSGIILIFNGALLLKHGDKNIGSRLTLGWGYILWGLHQLDFIFLHSISWITPWGFLFAHILALICSVSAIYYYFDMKNKELRRAKERLEYLSIYDTLTGLFSRNYFEQEIKRLDKEKRLERVNRPPTGIIICDVDGLKLVNDTLGHERGDGLLVEAARIIKGLFADRGLAARIGGDEFAVLLEEEEEGLKQAWQDIRQAVASYNSANQELPLSISVGYASDRIYPGLIQVFKEADNNMYREKLKQSQGVRDAIVESLMLALDKKDFSHRKVEHLQVIILDLYRALGLTAASEADLCLFAKYHDIGKVVVADEILFKPGPLNAEEKEEIFRHCEIGYRIAQAATELAPIADWILKHHEWWNGEGYPLGLKGEEIPVECRILAIADAYEAMTNFRPYGKRASPRAALKELRKWAGIQFDPDITEVFCKMSLKK